MAVRANAPGAAEGDRRPRRGAGDRASEQDSDAGARADGSGLQSTSWWCSPLTRIGDQAVLVVESFINCGRSSTGRRCETDPRYTPSDVFETFPAPESDGLARTDRARLWMRAPRDHAASRPWPDEALQPGQRSGDHRRGRPGRRADAGDSRRTRRGGDGCVRLVGHPARSRLPHLPADGALDGQPGRAGRDPRPAAWRRTTAAPRLEARPAAKPKRKGRRQPRTCRSGRGDAVLR